MNRRGFLQFAAASVASLAIDPEQLLWIPGKKTIFLPERRPFSLHEAFTEDIYYSQAALDKLKRNFNFGLPEQRWERTYIHRRTGKTIQCYRYTFGGIL